MEGVGWRERDWAKFTDEELRRLYGASRKLPRSEEGRALSSSRRASHPSVNSGRRHRYFGKAVGIVILVALGLVMLGQLPRNEPLVGQLHFAMPSLASLRGERAGSSVRYGCHAASKSGRRFTSRARHRRHTPTSGYALRAHKCAAMAHTRHDVHRRRRQVRISGHAEPSRHDESTDPASERRRRRWQHSRTAPDVSLGRLDPVDHAGNNGSLGLFDAEEVAEEEVRAGNEARRIEARDFGVCPLVPGV